MRKTLDAISGTISNVFNDITRLEETFLKKSKFRDVSPKEIRTIEAIGNCTIKNMGTIAKKLDITVGTLTVCITNLEKKGYVRREKSLNDRRIVNINLTEKGKKMFKLYCNFREEILKDIIINLNSKEKEVFSDALNTVSKVLNKKCHSIIEVGENYV